MPFQRTRSHSVTQFRQTRFGVGVGTGARGYCTDAARFSHHHRGSPIVAMRPHSSAPTNRRSWAPSTRRAGRTTTWRSTTPTAWPSCSRRCTTTDAHAPSWWYTAVVVGRNRATGSADAHRTAATSSSTAHKWPRCAGWYLLLRRMLLSCSRSRSRRRWLLLLLLLWVVVLLEW